MNLGKSLENFLRRFFPAVLAPALCAGCACSQNSPEPGAAPLRGRMNRNRLNIGAYTLNPEARSERHVREIAECGIDFMVCVPPDRRMLDYFQKYGVGAVVNEVMPGWWGGDGQNAGQLRERNPVDGYIAAAEKFQDHPAVWGVDIGDEPSALDFPYYGEVFRCVREHLPSQFPYLNLYPNYASTAENDADNTISQLGTKTYEEYIAEYCANLPADYLCYDYYLYAAGVQRHYENLRIAAEACRGTGRSLWIVLQVNSSDPEKWITADQLRFQANSALAFGAENIIWACYSRCWWQNQVLDDNGEKTRQYDRLRTVNAEIRALADEYMRYRNVGTSFIGFPAGAPDLAALTGTTPADSLSTGIFKDLRSEDGCGIIAGRMTPRQRGRGGAEALFICAADDPMDEHHRQFRVTFRCDGCRVDALGAPLARNPDGSYTLTMESCGGALVTAGE